MDIIMPQLGETVLEGIITAWYKKPGEPVAADESLFEVETDKVSTAIPAPAPGVLREILVDTGVSVKVGTRLAVIDTSVSATTTTPQLASARSPKLSPLVRRLLAESGLEPDQVRGTGRDGRITREDMQSRIAGATPTAPSSGPAAAVPTPPAHTTVTQQPPHADATPPSGPPAPSGPTASPDDRVVPLSKIRRATAAHMARSVATSPHTLQAVEVDFQNVDRARNTRAADWKVQEGFTLTYLPFVCAATCEALADFPYINATFANDALIVHRRINLGIAVDLGFEGLLVPVLRDANHRSIRGLARKIHTLAQKAKTNTLTPDDLNGGTYTISNSGSFGTLITAPIINQPQVAILSLDGVHKKPIVVESPDGDAIAIRPVGVLAQSFDHRAFDGAYSAAFLRRLKQALETRNWLTELN